MAASFDRITVLGTGLIGGSFGLALRKHLPEARVTGWDKEDVLREAESRGTIHKGCADLSRAISDADLIYIALPIALTIELLPEIARCAAPHALVTDAGSTKAAICNVAAKHFRNGPARFLGGHPLAGSELSGVAHSNARLFHSAKYALIGEPGEADARGTAFAALLQRIGAAPVWLDAQTHDWAVAIISHLPQLVSVALAGVVHEETDETGLPVSLAGRGLRDLLRLAGSPYPLWRDIALTNRENIARALDRLAQAIEHLRTRLTSRELEAEFAAANDLYKTLRNVQ